MAAFEVATPLVINKSLHVLSEGEILSSGVPDNITTAVSHLQTVLITLMLLQSGTDNDEQSGDPGPGLLRRARDAAADKFLLEASQHLKYRKGCLAKIRALVRFTLLRARVCPSEIKGVDLITRVHILSAHLSQTQDPPRDDMLTLDVNASLRNMHRGKVCWNGKIESDIVGREAEVLNLLARLTLKDGGQDALRLSIVWVVAEEPIGKTALVRSVYNRLEVDHSFQCRVWVHLPEKVNLKDLLVKILKQTTKPELKDLENKRHKYPKEMLHKSLMELRYLIVFDNLREAKVMDYLMTLLLDSRNGSNKKQFFSRSSSTQNFCL